MGKIFPPTPDLEPFLAYPSSENGQRHVDFCLQCMKKTLREDIYVYETTMKGSSPLAAPGLDFDKPWMVFKPGELVYHRIDSEDEMREMRRTMLSIDPSIVH